MVHVGAAGQLIGSLKPRAGFTVTSNQQYEHSVGALADGVRPSREEPHPAQTQWGQPGLL